MFLVKAAGLWAVNDMGRVDGGVAGEGATKNNHNHKADRPHPS